MENETPLPDEKKAKYDPQSGEVEPAPIEMEGARVMANEAADELDDETPLDKDDVRQLAEDYVTRRGADDTENFKARVFEGAPGKDQAEERGTGGEPLPRER
jgi:hypothetical protein